MRAKALAVLGTGSDVGKSVITAGLCRLLSDRGYRVAPFKAQNMSNNSFVTVAGGEMGRAQVVQAQAARVEPHVDMNPVLIKPMADSRSQVVVQGRVWGDWDARDYYQRSAYCAERAYESLDRLLGAYEAVCLEGAGSCAEMNLRRTDFVNFRAAQHARAPVLLVADIDRGGVFAQLLGTLALLDEQERRMVKGLIVNKFRGDLSLFADGVDYIERRAGVPVLGVVPYMHDLALDEEDAVCIDREHARPFAADAAVRIGVVRLPHLSNFTDFAPLQRTRGVALRYLTSPSDLGSVDCLVLPGTKNVRGDLAWLRRQGFGDAIAGFRGRLVGICGGYQMLGRTVSDPYGVEGSPGESAGLGLLEVNTVLGREKRLARVAGRCARFDVPVRGYEIHAGATTTGERGSPLLHICDEGTGEETDDGWLDASGRVMGTYVHGLFDEPSFRAAFLRWVAGPAADLSDACLSAECSEERGYDQLAAHLQSALDIDRCVAILEQGLD